ncbi:MAG: hypothetical protein SGARI_006913, partial [Bacillariaceae sp.]
MALTKTYPAAASHNNINNTNFKLQLVTLHPAEPVVAYLLESSGGEVDQHEGEIASTLQKSVVVQHSQTRQVLWTMSVAEIAALLLSNKQDSAITSTTADILLSKTGEAKLYKFVKEQLGKVQNLQFLDPSSLYWKGFATPPKDAAAAEDEDGAADLHSPRWSQL